MANKFKLGVSGQSETVETSKNNKDQRNKSRIFNVDFLFRIRTDACVESLNHGKTSAV